MSLAGFLGSRRRSRVLPVVLHRVIMQDGRAVRNEDEQDNWELLPSEHPWSTQAGLALKALRESLDLGQHELGVSRGMVSLLERGETRPGIGTLEKIATALGVPVPALLPPETKEAAAFSKGVAHAYKELEATLVDLQHRLGLGEGTPGGRRPAGLGAVREGRKARPARPRRKPPEDEQDTG